MQGIQFAPTETLLPIIDYCLHESSIKIPRLRSVVLLRFCIWIAHYGGNIHGQYTKCIESFYCEHIPVIWFEPPQEHRSKRQLLIFFHHLSGSKETTVSLLQDFAALGFVALSFDAWQHGERGTESPQELAARVFGNFRRHMWPILGQTTLDTMRIIDWAVSSLNVASDVCLGGLSMGGDIAVAAAGIDNRIKRVAAVVATPDWLRPGMKDAFQPGTIMLPGVPGSYAQYFYDRSFNEFAFLKTFSGHPFLMWGKGYTRSSGWCISISIQRLRKHILQPLI